MTWPAAGWLALTLALTPAATSGAADKAEPVTLLGKVVTLADALKSAGLPFDAEPVANQVVLRGDDGAITPLLSDDASRALFQDDRLRNRRTEVQGRRHPGLPYLQVVSFRIEDQGRLRTPEYY
jgi:CelD/BcsL family acetyltransferase involved in cellulose biosynthesis